MITVSNTEFSAKFKTVRNIFSVTVVLYLIKYFTFFRIYNAYLDKISWISEKSGKSFKPFLFQFVLTGVILTDTRETVTTHCNLNDNKTCQNLLLYSAKASRVRLIAKVVQFLGLTLCMKLCMYLFEKFCLKQLSSDPLFT